MIFFILSIGRSGTKFLAKLLNQSENALILHEPVEEDYIALPKAYHDEEFAYKYVKNFRLNKIKQIMKDNDVRIYGETGNQMRRFIDPIKKLIPDVKFIHLIRDGRDVVRSYMSRGIYDEKNRFQRFFMPMKNLALNGKLVPLIRGSWNYITSFILRKLYNIQIKYTNDIYPIGNDPYKDLWKKMSRFEKVCWYWQNEHLYLTQKLGPGVQFEKILSDYEYFKHNILDPLDLKISKNLWEKYRSKKINITTKYKFPPWNQWDNVKTNIFWKICGRVMELNGYNNDNTTS
ncbi:MAG: sulfotransferase [Candidatus Helarchaeota archaeon]